MVGFSWWFTIVIKQVKKKNTWNKSKEMVLYHALSQEFNEKTHTHQKKTNLVHDRNSMATQRNGIKSRPDDVLKIPGSLKPILHQTIQVPKIE